MASEVTLTFSGDDKDLQRSLDGVGDSLNNTGRQFDSVSDHADKFADSADGLTKNTRGGKDVLDGFSDSMEALGITLPGPIGNIAGMAGGVADMADGMGTLAAPALAKMNVAMKAMNATMRANPILTVVTVLALLVAGFVLAYKKSEKFRAVVHGAMDGAKAAVQGFGDAFNAVKDGIGRAIDFLFDKISWLWHHSPLGLLVGSLDKIGGVAGKLGGAVGGVLGKFANGGYPQGLSVVGENGPELFDGRTGRIMSNSASRQVGGGAQAVTVTVNLQGGPREFMDWMRKQVRVDGGIERALA
ncbi:MAG: hypothetical protein M3N43_06480 [Actinomycetota bacterium]|nr:hypothetical protein [Actinomycetota bacterium]